MFTQTNKGTLQYSVDAPDTENDVTNEQHVFQLAGEGEPIDNDTTILLKPAAWTPDDPSTVMVEGFDMESSLDEVEIGPITFYRSISTTRGANPLTSTPPYSATGDDAQDDGDSNAYGGDDLPEGVPVTIASGQLVYLKLDHAIRFHPGQIVMLTNNVSRQDITFEVRRVVVSPSNPRTNGYLALTPHGSDYTPSDNDDIKLGTSLTDQATLVAIETQPGYNAPANLTSLRFYDDNSTNLPRTDDLAGTLEYFYVNERTAYFILHYDNTALYGDGGLNSNPVVTVVDPSEALYQDLGIRRSTLKLDFSDFDNGNYTYTRFENDAPEYTTRWPDIDTFTIDGGRAPTADEFFNSIPTVSNLNFLNRVFFYDDNLGVVRNGDLLSATGNSREYETWGLKGYWEYERTSLDSARIILLDEIGAENTGEAFYEEININFDDPINPDIFSYDIRHYEQAQSPILIKSGEDLSFSEELTTGDKAPPNDIMQKLIEGLGDDLFAAETPYLREYLGPDGQDQNNDTVPDNRFSGGAGDDGLIEFFASEIEYDLSQIDITQLYAYTIKNSGASLSTNGLANQWVDLSDATTTADVVNILNTYFADAAGFNFFVTQPDGINPDLIHLEEPREAREDPLEPIPWNDYAAHTDAKLYVDTGTTFMEVTPSIESSTPAIQFTLSNAEIASVNELTINYMQGGAPSTITASITNSASGNNIALALNQNTDFTDNDIVALFNGQVLTIYGGTSITEYTQAGSEISFVDATPNVSGTALSLSALRYDLSSSTVENLELFGIGFRESGVDKRLNYVIDPVVIAEGQGFLLADKIRSLNGLVTRNMGVSYIAGQDELLITGNSTIDMFNVNQNKLVAASTTPPSSEFLRFYGTSVGVEEVLNYNPTKWTTDVYNTTEGIWLVDPDSENDPDRTVVKFVYDFVEWSEATFSERYILDFETLNIINCRFQTIMSVELTLGQPDFEEEVEATIDLSEIAELTRADLRRIIYGVDE